MDSQALETTGATNGTRTPRRRRRVAGALGVAALLGLTLGGAAVAADSPSPTTVATSVTAGAATAPGLPAADQAKLDAAFAAYRACMKEHGVALPEPVAIGTGQGTGPLVVSGSAGAESGATIVGGGVIAGGAAVDAAALPALDAGPFAAADAACKPILEAAGIKAATISSSAGGQLDVAGPGRGAPGGSVGGVVVGAGAGAAADLAKMVADARTYATCMRTHGVDVPDPVVNEKAGTFEMKLGADPGSAAFRAADAVCSVGSMFGVPVPPAPAGK
jgi:hypothetical protein